MSLAVRFRSDARILRDHETEQLERLPPEAREEIEAVGAVVKDEGEIEPAPWLMKIDLHCHSEASSDCSTPLELIPARCKACKIQVQAITDHNTISGALELKEMVEELPQSGRDHLTIIVGEEITTTQGEIIGLFLAEPVEAGLSPEETVERIKAQGGVVLIPHGFDPLKRWRLKPAALEHIADRVDIVETFNARVSRPRWNRAAVRWAEDHDLLMSAGSDAHTLADIGSAWVEVPFQTIEGPEDLRRALDGGIPVGTWTHPLTAFTYKMWDRSRRRLARFVNHITGVS